MSNARSFGPTIVGIVNIPLGILGGIGAWMFMGEGSRALNIASALEGAAGGADVGSAFSAGGSSMMIKGLIALVGFAAAAFGGIGLIRRSGWGRLCTIAGGALVSIFMVLRASQGDMTAFNWGLMGYVIAMTGAMFIPAWKAEFQSEDITAGLDFSADEQYRKAA